MFSNRHHKSETKDPSLDKNIDLVNLIGIEKRYRPSKHYVHILEIHWSDKTISTIYRKYSEFFNFHVGLYEIFPEESGKFGTSMNVLPSLPEQKMFREEVERVANKRHLDLQGYCRSLIKLDDRISQHKHVKKFFEARKDDLDPPRHAREKPERSRLMKALEVLPFVPGKKKKEENDVPLPRSASMSILDESSPVYMSVSLSTPRVLQTYRAIAEFKAEKKTDLSLAEDELIDVIEKNENGWWFVQSERGQGWAPATYLESLNQFAETDNSDTTLNYEQYLVRKDYVADQEDEISIKKGAIVNVMNKCLDGWWIIHHNDKVGYAPATFLVPYGSSTNSPVLAPGDEAIRNTQDLMARVSREPSIRTPTQRRCTIRPKLILADQIEKRQSPDYLSMCIKMSSKLEERQKRQSAHALELLQQNSSDRLSEDYENSDVIESLREDYENSDVIESIRDNAMVRPEDRDEDDDEDELDYEVIEDDDEAYLQPTDYNMNPEVCNKMPNNIKPTPRKDSVFPPNDTSASAYYNTESMAKDTESTDSNSQVQKPETSPKMAAGAKFFENLSNSVNLMKNAQVSAHVKPVQKPKPPAQSDKPIQLLAHVKAHQNQQTQPKTEKPAQLSTQVKSHQNPQPTTGQVKKHVMQLPSQVKPSQKPQPPPQEDKPMGLVRPSDVKKANVKKPNPVIAKNIQNNQSNCEKETMSTPKPTTKPKPKGVAAKIAQFDLK